MFPQIRWLAAAESGAGSLLGAAIGPYRASEQALAGGGLPLTRWIARPWVIVGTPKFTPDGLPMRVIMGSIGLEIKGGGTPLYSTYQLRLMTYRALVENEPLTILTTRTPNATFADYLPAEG